MVVETMSWIRGSGRRCRAMLIAISSRKRACLPCRAHALFQEVYLCPPILANNSTLRPQTLASRLSRPSLAFFAREPLARDLTRHPRVEAGAGRWKARIATKSRVHVRGWFISPECYRDPCPMRASLFRDGAMVTVPQDGKSCFDTPCL